MRPSLSCAACAGLLLAAGAPAAAEPGDPPAAEASGAKAGKSSTVTVFVTVHDAKGKETDRHSTRVEGPDARDWGVAPEGTKLTMPAGVPPDVLVLIPSATCKVTLTPAQVAGGSVTIAVERQDGGARCAATAGRPAAAPSSASQVGDSGEDARESGTALLGALP